MTPEQQLQEAKDQCAKHLGCKDWNSYMYAYAQDTIANFMYEAGKKEGPAADSEGRNENMRLRNALCKIAEYGPISRFSAHDDIDDIQKIAREALGE